MRKYKIIRNVNDHPSFILTDKDVSDCTDVIFESISFDMCYSMLSEAQILTTGSFSYNIDVNDGVCYIDEKLNLSDCDTWGVNEMYDLLRLVGDKDGINEYISNLSVEEYAIIKDKVDEDHNKYIDEMELREYERLKSKFENK
jgi:hypothetical protein